METTGQVIVPAEPTNGHPKEYPGEILDELPELKAEPWPQSIEVAWLLWARRHLLLRVAGWSLLVFTLVAFLLPKHYQAVTQLMPPDYSGGTDLGMMMGAFSGGDEGTGGGSGGGMAGAGASIANALLGLNSPAEMYVGVLRSRTVEDRMIQRFNLMTLYHTTYPEDCRAKLEEATDLDIDRKSGIISITVDDKNPDRAASMARAYVEEMNSVLMNVNTSSAHRERVFLENRLRDVKQDLDESSKQFSEFSSKNTAIDVPEQAKAMVSAAAELQGQLIAAQAELNGLRQIYTDNNSRVRQMQATVSALQKQINDFGGKDVNPETDSTLSQQQLYPSIRQLPLLAVRYMDLLRRTKIDEKVFEMLTKEYEIAKVEEAKELPTMQVLDVAVPPQKKSSPHRLLIMLVGMMGTVLMFAAWIVAEEVWGRVDAGDERKVLAAEVFAILRAKTWESSYGMRARRLSSAASSRVGKVLRLPSGEPQQPTSPQN